MNGEVPRSPAAEPRSPAIEVETERLRLRQWRDDDYAPFAAMGADPRVMEFLPMPLDRAASDALADRLRGFIDEHGWGLWAVEIRGGASFIGFVGLNIPTWELPFTPCVEIGWRLAAAHWESGYATEAARAALRVGFEKLGHPEIVAFASKRNARSIAVMERIGMIDTDRDFDHPALPVGHGLRRHVLYSITRADHERRAASRR